STRRHTRFSRDWSSDVCSSDLHELLVTQLTGNRSEDTGTNGRVLIVQKYRRVTVKTDQRPVWTTHTLTGTNYYSLEDLAFLHLAAWDGFLDGHLDDIPNAGVTPVRSAQDLDTHNLTCTAVIRDFKHCLSLNHGCSPGELHLGSAFSNLNQSPALGLGDRTGFLDGYDVADVALIAFIVRMDLG